MAAEHSVSFAVTLPPEDTQLMCPCTLCMMDIVIDSWQNDVATQHYPSQSGPCYNVGTNTDMQHPTICIVSAAFIHTKQSKVFRCRLAVTLAGIARMPVH